MEAACGLFNLMTLDLNNWGRVKLNSGIEVKHDALPSFYNLAFNQIFLRSISKRAERAELSFHPEI